MSAFLLFRILGNDVVHKRGAENQHEAGGVLVWFQIFVGIACVPDATGITRKAVKFLQPILKSRVKVETLCKFAKGCFALSSDFFCNGFHCTDGFLDAVFIVGVFSV